MYLRTVLTAIARIHLGLNIADRYGQLWHTFQACTTRTTTRTRFLSEDYGNLKEQRNMGIDYQREETTMHCNTVVRHGDLITALHHSTSPA